MDEKEKVEKVRSLSKKNRAKALAFAVLFATTAAVAGCTPRDEEEEEYQGSGGSSTYIHTGGTSSKTSFWGKPSTGGSGYSSVKSGVSS